MPTRPRAGTGTGVGERGTAGGSFSAPSSPDDPIAVRDVRKNFGNTTVLRGVDLDVPGGSLVALLGPSGCGKTTLLRTIAGLERPDGGRITLGERTLYDDTTFVAPERRRIGMVFQDWALFPHLTVGRNVGFGLDRSERRSGRIEEALALVELMGLADRMPATLSGGQQQRVALARALANRPAALLLDEPFSNLDATLRGSIRAEVNRLLHYLSVTAVFVTHDQEEAFLLGDEVAVMLDGRIVQQGKPADIYERPASRSVAAFVGDANFVHGTAAGDKADTPLGPVPLLAEFTGAVEVIVRPEQLHVVDGDQGSVTSVEYYGHDAVSEIAFADGTSLRVRCMAAPQHRPGDRVDVQYIGEPAVAFESN